MDATRRAFSGATAEWAAIGVVCCAVAAALAPGRQRIEVMFVFFREHWQFRSAGEEHG